MGQVCGPGLAVNLGPGCVTSGQLLRFSGAAPHLSRQRVSGRLPGLGLAHGHCVKLVTSAMGRTLGLVTEQHPEGRGRQGHTAVL